VRIEALNAANVTLPYCVTLCIFKETSVDGYQTTRHQIYKDSNYIRSRKLLHSVTFLEIEVRECLLSFGAESVVFQVARQKLKD
jgi:hypothetical protein